MLEILFQPFIYPVPAIVEQWNHSSRSAQEAPGSSLTDHVSSLWQGWQPSESVEQLRKAADRTLAFAEIAATPDIDRPAVPAPPGWRSQEISKGITVYNAPSEEAIAVIDPVIASESSGIAGDGGERGIGVDGTRFPYVTEVSWANLRQQEIAPQQYVWEGTWQGEGYSRERDRQGQLIAQREGGADIHLGITFDAAITNPAQPNLKIVLINDQAVTAQVTNLSAFLMDRLTGETLERRDFEQLPPAYEVTLTLNGGYEGVEFRVLEPLGTQVFEYHVSEADLKTMFPIKLQGINRLFDERVQEIETLKSEGWVVLEVPPPS